MLARRQDSSKVRCGSELRRRRDPWRVVSARPRAYTQIFAAIAEGRGVSSEMTDSSAASVGAASSTSDNPSTKAPANSPSLWRIHRRVYDWTLSWSETPHATVALFLLAFAESSIFPVPPDVLLIAMVLASRTRWVRLALVCTVGSVLGGIAGYAIGMFLMETVGAWVIRFYHAEKLFEQVRGLYMKYDYWIVFSAAFTPIPYKVFTIASGAFDMNLLGFTLVSFVGRGARFFLVAGLLYLFGAPIKRLIDKYFDLLAILFVVLLVGGFVIIKYLM